MTAKTDLPPLPERFDYTNSSAYWCYSRYTMTRDDLGDYVLAEDYDALRNASEALQTEIEALRAERDALREALAEADEAMRFVYTACATFPGEPRHIQNAAWRRIVNAVTKARAVLEQEERK